MFNKRSKSNKCEMCSSSVSDRYSYCPHCGNNLLDLEKTQKDYGMLGKNDFSDLDAEEQQGFGIADKMLNSVFNSLMKNLEKQFKHLDQDSLKDLGKAEIKSLPNGIRIKIGPGQLPPHSHNQPTQKPKQKNSISTEQIKKMETFPRESAKSSIKRLSNKIVYELATPGVESVSDIFISKTESGYEIKAIGSKKIYVNSLPIELPLKSYSISKNKLMLEFKPEE